MPPKHNPLNLNPLQLKTLTLLQALAVLPDAKPGDAEGSVLLTSLPDPHGVKRRPEQKEKDDAGDRLRVIADAVCGHKVFRERGCCEV